MQNDLTNNLLDDLENLSIELDNLSNPGSAVITSEEITRAEDSTATEDPVSGSEQVHSDLVAQDTMDLESMIHDIVQQALPSLTQQLTNQLKHQAPDVIESLYQQSLED